MEEAWVGKGRDVLPFPLEEAKSAIRHLKQRLEDYLLTVQTEIIPAAKIVDENDEPGVSGRGVGNERRGDGVGGGTEGIARVLIGDNGDINGDNDTVQIFGNAFGSNDMAINLY